MINSISLVIITKNSEDTISKTIKSCIGLVDEVIVVDTGTTDNTREVRLKYSEQFPLKLKIYDFEWINNFSAARNYGINNASGDWILILDVDEYILNTDFKTINNFKNNPINGALIFTQKSYRQDKPPLMVKSIRMFRNIPGVRYQFAVHEMVNTHGLNNLKISETGIFVEHDGYETEHIIKQKEKRNLNILKRELLKGKLNDYEYFHYGVYYLRSNMNISPPSSQEKKIGDNLINLKNKANIENNHDFGQDFFIFYSVIPEFISRYFDLNLLNELWNEALLLYPLSPYIYFKFAEGFYKFNFISKSIELLEKCLSFKIERYDPDKLIDPGILDYLSKNALEKCYEKIRV